MNHIIEISGALTFCQGSDFFCKNFFKAVAFDSDAATGRIRIGMMDFSNNWIQDQDFISGQIKLDSGKITPGLHGAAIPNPSLGRHATAIVLIYIKADEILGNLNACLIIDPLCDFLETWYEKFLIQVIGFEKGKVQIFGKAVGFKKTFFQTGSALKNPA
jgi:hypothetical protein